MEATVETMTSILRSPFRSPAVGLYFLAPLIAEFFLGDFPIVMLPLLIPLSLWYGGGALLIREVARRRGLGWRSILLMGLAFAIVEEGLLTMSLFNPDYADQRLLDRGHVAMLGIGIPWTIFVLALHVGWSVATPIALMETAQPGRRTEPWLSRPALRAVVGITVVGAAVVFGTNYPAYGHFIASAPQLIVSAAIAALLVTIALRTPGSARVDTGQAPRAGMVFATTMLCAGAFHLGMHAPTTAAVIVMTASIAALLTALAAWSRRPGWDQTHVFAVAAGMLLTYSWRAFTAGYGSGTADLVLSLVSYTVYALAAVAILTVCRRRMSGVPGNVQLSV
ncbi:hypothetical protein ASG12_15900 [Williamsia sp. Leaf354]|nr:hypothetical protein ASG12_15900 [Williamsia sp. Leaf354]